MLNFNRKIILAFALLVTFTTISVYYIQLPHNTTANDFGINFQNEDIKSTEIPTENFQLYADEDDANSGGDAGDSLPFATAINPGDYNGTLTASDKDYYTFNVLSGVIINITMIPYNLSMNFDLTLYNPDFIVIKTDFKGAGIRETLFYSTLSTGSYSASITPNTVDQVGNYSFALGLCQQNDFNSTTDAGNQFNNALEIEEGTSNGTLVWGSDELDFYKIDMEKGQIIDIKLQTRNSSNIDLFFIDSVGVNIKVSEKIITLDERIYYAINKNDVYKIKLIVIENIDTNPIIPYNLSIIITYQNDANTGTDAGNTIEDALLIIPLTDSRFNGKLVFDGDDADFYSFSTKTTAVLYLYLTIYSENVNFDLYLYDEEKTTIIAKTEPQPGAPEAIQQLTLSNGTFYIGVIFESGTPVDEILEGSYLLQVGLVPNVPTGSNGNTNWRELVPLIISSVLIPIFLIIILIFVLYLFTEVRIPWVSNKLDKYFSRDGSGETVKSLKYALKVRDQNIDGLREELIEKDGKRAKDLEKIHRLEEDQKSKDIVLSKIRDESKELKNRLDNLQAVNDDLANIIDSTIRRQFSKSTKTTQKINVSSITSLLWLSEDRLKSYIDSIPLLNERYILDRSKNFIITKEYAREIVRQAYWKRIGAMHLKKIKQVKVQSLSEDTNIDINTVKLILRELVERKEIPAPIHMDRVSLLLSISEELIAEMTEIAQNTPIISLKEISNSYDTTEESAKIIFNKIAEEGYVNGEFINDDKFVVFDLFTNAVADEGSIDVNKFAEEHNLKDEEEEIKILIEKQLQAKKLKGVFMTEDLFLCFNYLTDQLSELVENSVEDINRGDTRRVVFDIGSVVESIVKQSLILDIHESDDVTLLTNYQEVIESKELGKIIRAAEDEKVSLPAFVELKSINRYWAQKIKHTKPGELPYIPSVEESLVFLFESNRALNKILSQKIPAKWKKLIAKNLLSEKLER